MSRIPRALKLLFSPPRFADEEKTIEARKIWIILWAMMGLVIVQSPILLYALSNKGERIITSSGAFIVAGAGMLALVRIGRSRLAAVLLAGVALALLTFATWTSGGMHAPGMMGMLLVVTVSGLLLGAGAGRLAALAAAFCGLGLATAEMRGWLPPPSTLHNPLSIWVVYTMYLVLLALVQSLYAWVAARSDAARKAGEAIRQRLFESSLIPVMVVDATTFRFVDCNDAAVKIHRMSSREEILGKTPLDVSSPAQYDGTPSIQKIRQYLVKVLAEGSTSFEWRHQRPNGEIWDATVNLMAFKADERQLLQITLQDITERKRAREEQEKLQAQLIQSQKMEAVGRLAGGVAHDYNNILTSTMMQLEFLRSEPGLSREVLDVVKDLEADAARATSLTRQLLLFSRRQMIQRQVLDLNSLLGNLLSMLRRLIGEHYSIEFDMASGSLWLEADPGMLEQVVMNLVVNARDAMPQGGRITISSQRVVAMDAAEKHNAKARPQRCVCLTVADTGTGMSEETQRHIFEPFYTTKEASKGTGLGLATVYGIVQQHSGWIEVDTTLGEGTKIDVFLPGSEKSIQGASGHHSVEQIFSGTETLLLVEDEQSVRRTVASALRHHGYQVIEAECGADALSAWESARDQIDLLITDSVMPGEVSGPELARRLQAERPGLKVILMSGYSPEIAKGGGLASRDTRFLQKPFKLVFLARMVREYLDSSSSGAVEKTASDATAEMEHGHSRSA